MLLLFRAGLTKNKLNPMVIVRKKKEKHMKCIDMHLFRTMHDYILQYFMHQK